jgi:hypothetical protein
LGVTTCSNVSAPDLAEVAGRAGALKMVFTIGVT